MFFGTYFYMLSHVLDAYSNLIMPIRCSVDAHGRRRVLLCWRTWKGNAFSIVYGSLQIITVIELCKQTYVMYPNMTFGPISTDLRVLTNFQQPESFSAFNSVYNNSGLFGIYAVTVSFFPGVQSKLCIPLCSNN